MKRGYRNLVWGLLVAWFAFGPVMALAEDCYKIIHGKGNPVCRKLGRNLNRFCDAPPMRCEIRIHPDFEKDFSLPKWEDLDPVTHIELVAELARAHASVSEDCIDGCETRWRELKWQEYRPKLMEGIGLGRIRFSRARLDIDHDGKKELVFRLMDTGCPQRYELMPPFSGNASLMVLNEATGKFDREFRRDVSVGRCDVLMSQGRALLTFYDRLGKTWSIYELHSHGVERFVLYSYPICEYRILENNENGRSNP